MSTAYKILVKRGDIEQFRVKNRQTTQMNANVKNTEAMSPRPCRSV